MSKYYIDGYNLTLDDVVKAIKGELGVIEISKEARDRCINSRSQIDKWLEEDAPVIYGVNTGLGNLKDTALSPEEHLKWNKTIPYPHAVGMGNPIDVDITRASLLIRANLLCRGYSAVRPQLIERMLDIFNAKISPVILELGSTGLSDLGPLAQSAMVVAGLDEAEVIYRGERMKAQVAYKKAGLDQTFELQCKEVLSQMNGSTMTQSLACFAYHKLDKLIKINKANIKEIATIDSLDSEKIEVVTKSIDKSMKFVLDILNFENNITCDNPLLFEVENGGYEPVMGCNCSNTQVGYVLDLMSILITEVANLVYLNINAICEKSEYVNKLKYIVLSMSTRARALCIPASADSIPTKANQEDHVEFSYGAARKAMKGVEVLKKIIACEVCAVSIINGEQDDIGSVYDMINTYEEKLDNIFIL